MRANLPQVIGIVLLVGLGVVGVIAQQPNAKQTVTVAPVDETTIVSLSAEEKQELLRKKEQFERLSDAEKERLRRMHAELASDPDAPRLAAIMSRYHEWLQTLRPLERDELLSMQPEQRLTRIKHMLSLQQRERFEQMAQNIPKEDIDAILQWLENFAQRHEQRIFAGLPPEARQRYDQIDDATRKRRMLVFALNFRPPGAEPIIPQREEFQELLPQLTKSTQEKLAQTQDKGELVKLWIRGAALSRMMPPPTEKQLMDLLAELPAKDRSALEGMSSEDMRNELTKKFYQFRMGRGKDSYRPSFFGSGGPPFSPHTGPFEPPSDNGEPRKGYKGGPPGSRPFGRPPGEGTRGDRPGQPRENGPPPNNGGGRPGEPTDKR